MSWGTVALKPELHGTPAPVAQTRQLGGDTRLELREWTLANDKCPEVISDRARFAHYHICARPIKTEGAELCNLHLAHERKAQEKAQARVVARQEAANNEAEAENRRAALGMFGIKSYATWELKNPTDHMRQATGGLSLTPEAVDRLLEILNKK